MLFKEEKRAVQKIKVKPSILLLAKEIAEILDPYDEEPCIDKLFERLVTQTASNFIEEGVVFKSLPVEEPVSIAQEINDFALDDDEPEIEPENDEPVSPIDELLAQEN